MKTLDEKENDLSLGATDAIGAADLSDIGKIAREVGMRRPPSFLERNALLRLPQVLQVIPVGKSAWWNGIREGRYPRGVKLSPRVTVWSSHEILALVDSCIAARDTGGAR